MVTAILITAAASLLESAPFLLAGAVCSRIRRSSRWVPYACCGCGTGPAARSFAATAAMWFAFGPAIACARFVVAILLDAIIIRNRSCAQTDGVSFLAELRACTVTALIGAVVTLFGRALIPAHAGALAFVFFGATLAFFATPCGVACAPLAAALRVISPELAAGFLCVAGLFDLRSWIRTPHLGTGNDTLAYLLCACACALVAVHGAAGLLHPRLIVPLWISAVLCAALAIRHRGQRNASLRVAPAVMVLGAVLAAPVPEYHATETTLADAFPGERVEFTGEITHTGSRTTLVRYAITCCRADARPVVVRLEHAAPGLRGWVRAEGILRASADGLQLHARTLAPVPAPADPFVYR